VTCSAAATVDIIDVVTRDSEHFEINLAAIEAGKHVLSEKPVAHDHHDVRRVAELARAKGLKTKVGFTFRYSPAVRYLKDMISRGDLARRSSTTPTSRIRSGSARGSRCATGSAGGPAPIRVASLEGYGAPVIDIGHWLMESDHDLGGRRAAQYFIRSGWSPRPG